MACCFLVVHVISANVRSDCNTTLNNCFVELRFNGQSKTTSKKNGRSPEWNKVFRFYMRQQADSSGDLTLEANVYILDQISNSNSLIGTVSLSDENFGRHSANVAAISCSWMSTTTDPVHGTLRLKVFLTTADQHLLETDHDVHDHLLETETDPLIKMINRLFGTDEHDQLPPIVLQPVDGIVLQPANAVPQKISPKFEPGRVVERMQHLFVRVVKARKLPDVDANGSLDPYVEVKFGAYNRGFTKCLKRNKNPEWNETFAFSFQHDKAPSPSVDVVVNDKDLVRDDFVGMLHFHLKDIPTRSPHDIPLEPTWYPLLDQGGKRLAQPSLLLAIWVGSQADEAYRHVWTSHFSPKVYENPRLWCLRVTIVETQGITVIDDDDKVTDVFCKACLGNQIQKIQSKQMASSGSYAWNRELVFVAAEPFFEGDLEVSVHASSGKDDDKVIGQITIPLTSIEKRADYDHLVIPKWFDLKNPGAPQLDGSVVDGNDNSQMRICLRNLLDGGYHIVHDRQGYMDDTRPADRQPWNPHPLIGSLQLGILRVIGLPHEGETDGASTLKPYCVAKYGDKWVRTRTVIDGLEYVFNEQHKWDVYDIATVLTVGVFDHCLLKENGSTNAHRKIGKVRIHLSCLQSGRIYAHSYPLLILGPDGAKKTGELQLAVQISSPMTVNMLRMYAQPTLPKMHYMRPLTDMEQSQLRSQAAKVLALQLDRMEASLSRGVVAYMCNADSYSLWSLRKSQANFNRIMAMVSSLVWFEGVCLWRNPATTLLAHSLFILALWFHELVLPFVLLYVVLVALWKYGWRPRCPPHVDYNLSMLSAHLDELAEEFDTPETNESDEVVRMRYDRLRSIAGKVESSVGDFAVQGERIQSLLSWRDPRATAIFEFFTLMAAVVVYFVPYKVLVAVTGFYIMRPPMLRRKTPSFFVNFFRRLPSKKDSLL